MYKPPSFKNINEAIRLRERTSGHSVFGPSQIDRIIKCPAAFREVLKAPIKPSGPAAQHGTKLHEVMESILGMAMPNPQQNHDYLALPIEDKAMVDDCMDFIKPILSNFKWDLEAHVSLETFGIPQISGTVDVIVHGTQQEPFPSHPVIVDWKFGGTPVFVENNSQLKCYALGALALLNNLETTHIKTYIAQPALNYFQSYTYSVDELHDFADELKAAITLAISPDAEYNPGRKQCMFCNAKMTCRARMEAAQENAAKVFDAVQIIRTVPQVARQEWVSVLDLLQEVEAVARDIRKFFHNEIWEGREVKGYKLVNGRGSRKFKNPVAAIDWIKNQYDLPSEKLYEVKPLSVAKIEKGIKGIKKDPDFKELIETKYGAPQLVKEDDKREAISVKTTFEGVDSAPQGV